MLARLLVFIGVPLTILPLVFRYAVLSATATAESHGFGQHVDQYAHQSSPYLLAAVNVGLVVGVIPLTVGIILLLRERFTRHS
jgi:hypothetical protein